jgi:predicted metal-dependent HD superfamily phosphohydrolase
VITLLESTGTPITEEHKDQAAFGDEDKHYFLDLDMAILGSEPNVYLEYADKIKQEYNFLPTNLYNSLRLKVFIILPLQI